MTEQQIIQLFVDAAEAHTGLKWSDVGTSTFLFNTQRDLIFPALFIQTQGATVANETMTNTFTIYCLDLPIMEGEINNQDFEWDKRLVESRDTTLQILQDIIGKVRVENGIHLTMTIGAFVQDNEQLDNATGWRVDLQIGHDFLTTNIGFPT